VLSPPEASSGLVLALAVPAVVGCASIPRGQVAVDAVSIHGNEAISASDIEEKMATTASPKFLGLFQGVVYDYALFDWSVFQRDLERVKRYYRARGFYEARVRASRVQAEGKDHVHVTIEVDEGQPVLVESLRVTGIDDLPPEDAEALREAMGEGSKQGAPFEEDSFRRTEVAMRRTLTERGYAWAKVARRADVDLPRHRAFLVFDVRPGPRATFGAVSIEGTGGLPEGPVRRALDIAPGEPYSSRAVEAAQQAVLDLGTWSAVEITPELAEPPPADAVVPLTVRVHPQKLRSLLVGGGLEIDPVRTEAHFHLGWEHKNFFGGFRHFIVELRPGVDLYPTRAPTFQAPTTLLPAERLRAELRQPGFLEARTNGVIRQEINTYPVLLSPNVDPRAPVLGYLESKSSLAIDRTFGKLLLAPSYDLQLNEPFTYLGERDPDLRGLALSYVDLLALLDLRDDKMRPHQGIVVEGDVQIAGLGGTARDVRVQPKVSGYVPIGRSVTLAARATVGFLFPMNYGDAARAANERAPGSADRAAWTRDVELIYLRGFFSGGPSSNRGYPLRGVGPHGSVPFYNPGLPAHALAASCAVGSNEYDLERCAVPLGGESLWEASIELRFPIHDPFGGAVFCDASDVSPYALSIRLDHPHLSCGLGLRYGTPIGPVRLDVGYRIPGAQLPAGTDPRVDSDPRTIYGLPFAFALGIGEAF
jgi:outer membrane protein insertion porin family/translocation and assembly module TamA